MNAINGFFIDNLIGIYFLYGLVFFSMGVMIAATCRRGASTFRFSQAIPALVAFGLLHGIHEWIMMFQIMAMKSGDYTLTVQHEVVRVIILVASFLFLLAFGMLLLSPEQPSARRLALPLGALLIIWLAGIAAANYILAPAPLELTQIADALARYALAIPGALLAGWALMRQQRTFREQDMPQFGRFLVWAAAAILLYGVVGQVFVRETELAPSMVLNGRQFWEWFGFPVQLFRTVVVGVFAYFLIKALDAFEVERQRRLQAANQATVEAQQAQIEAERRNRQEMERLNDELRLTTRELALLLRLANLLVAPIPLETRLHTVLEELVQNVPYCDKGLILLARQDRTKPQIATSVGFEQPDNTVLYSRTIELATYSFETGQAICERLDGTILLYHPADEEERQYCREYPSPMTMLCFPLLVQEVPIGSLAFSWPEQDARVPFVPEEFQLVFAATQQLGLSIENVRLTEEAQEREELLQRLLHQVVNAQEAERQRIARELHDATGQSLTAVSLGLRGVEAFLNKEGSAAAAQVHELGEISAQALGELRQIIADLRPSHLDDLGLVPAIRWYLSNYETQRSIHTTFEVKGEDFRVSPEYETVLFRIMQEAMTNIAKHAEASEAKVTFAIEPPLVTLTIEDNGNGFDVKEVLRRRKTYEGWGLLGMQERVSLLGGSVDFDSAPSQGTRITVTVPCTKDMTNDEKDETTSG